MNTVNSSTKRIPPQQSNSENKIANNFTPKKIIPLPSHDQPEENAAHNSFQQRENYECTLKPTYQNYGGRYASQPKNDNQPTTLRQNPTLQNYHGISPQERNKSQPTESQSLIKGNDEKCTIS